MIHISTHTHEGVEYTIEYDPEKRLFSTLLPFKRSRIEDSWERSLIQDAEKEIETRARKARRKKVSITFFGVLEFMGRPGTYTYKGIDLRNGEVMLEEGKGLQKKPRKVQITVIPAQKQGELEWAHAAYIAARDQFRALLDSGVRIETPYIK